MTKNILFTVMNKVLKACRKQKIKFVFMEGLAVSICAIPRATYDIDGIISLKKIKIGEFLYVLKKPEFGYDRRKPIKFIHDLPFITLCYERYKTYPV